MSPCVKRESQSKLGGKRGDSPTPRLSHRFPGYPPATPYPPGIEGTPMRAHTRSIREHTLNTLTEYVSQRFVGNRSTAFARRSQLEYEAQRLVRAHAMECEPPNLVQHCA